jgi:hypothetical protein
MFGKGGVHEVGTFVFTVIAWIRRASVLEIGVAHALCKRRVQNLVSQAEVEAHTVPSISALGH